MAADDSYTAADERAPARRAASRRRRTNSRRTRRGVTRRSSGVEGASPAGPPLRSLSHGSLYSWPDGELVTPDKLAAWLKEDILLRRVVPPQKKKPRARGKIRGNGNGEAVQVRQQREQEQLEAAAMAEAESLAEALEVPLAEAAELLADDREGYVPPTGLATAAVDLTEGSLLTRGTIDAYIAAVIELWRLQVAHGNANTENPGAPPYEDSLSNGAASGGSTTAPPLKTAEATGSRPATSDEWLRIQDLLLTGAAYTPQNLRTRVDLLFGHYYLLRGENRRKMELADLSLLDYPPSEARPLWLPAQLFFGAGTSPANPRPSGAVRTGIGSRSSSGGTASRSSYPTQLQETWRIFGAAGLIASKKTHLPRRVGAQDAETHGTSLAQISQAGRWNQSVLCQAYLTHLPRQFMRIVAGFSASPGDYFLARAAHEPPVLRLRPFGGPEWDEFAVAVRSTAVGAMEPNSQRLAIRLEARLDGIQGGLDALLQARSYHLYRLLRSRVSRGAGPSPAPAPASGTRHAYRHSPGKGLYGGDVWKEWEEGVQFCRRKVIWDELLARMASGKCKEAAVAELELLRAGRSLNRLVDELKQRRRRGQDRGQGQGQIRVQLEPAAS
ncbi:centromere DNA-binding protein complex CBF3 subunit [Hirsutella rhossiliensis]